MHLANKNIVRIARLILTSQWHIVTIEQKLVRGLVPAWGLYSFGLPLSHRFFHLQVAYVAVGLFAALVVCRTRLVPKYFGISVRTISRIPMKRHAFCASEQASYPSSQQRQGL